MTPLALPQPKRNPPPPKSPLPVPLGSLTGVPASNNYWSVYRGHLVGHDTRGPEGREVTVVIEKEEEATAVYENGFFGMLVEGNTWHDHARVVLEDWQPGSDMKCVQEDSDENEMEIKIEGTEDGKEMKEVEIENPDEIEDQYPQNWGELKSLSFKEEEDGNPTVSNNLPVVLHLELCEAFFLSYSLGCLTVSDPTQCTDPTHTQDTCTKCQMSLLCMWQLFCKVEQDFPVRYRVYHHFRSMGWVVRSGYCMGADWTLYKLGPPQYHASYTVRVETVDRKSGAVLEMGIKKITWADLLAQTRVAVTVKKEPLLVRVEVWGDQRDWDSPHCLGSMCVTTLRVKRWVVGDQRWTVKPRVPVQERGNSGCDKNAAVIILD